MTHHSPTINFTHSQTMPKLLKIKFSISFTSLSHETFHSYNKFFSSHEVVSKSPKHPLIYQPR